MNKKPVSNNWLIFWLLWVEFKSDIPPQFFLRFTEAGDEVMFCDAESCSEKEEGPGWTFNELVNNEGELDDEPNEVAVENFSNSSRLPPPDATELDKI